MRLSNAPYEAVHVPQRGRNQKRHGTWENALQVCNSCVAENQPDKLIKETETKSEQNHQLQKIEKEMADLKSSVSEIKTFMSHDKLADPSDTEIAHSVCGKDHPAKENVDGNRSRGIPESKKDDARCRQNHDFIEVQNVLEHIIIEAAISNATRLGKYDTNKTRTILFKVPNPYQRRMILLSARKLKPYGRPVFLSRQLSQEEAERENLVLIRRRVLLQQRANPTSLRIRDGVLNIRDGNKWIPDGETDNKSGTVSTWLSIVLNILVFNTWSILDYQRRAAFSNAVQIENCYHMNYLTETWLTEHKSDPALFLPSYELHRKDRPSDGGNTKHGGVLIPVTKNIPTNEIVTDFQDCSIIFLKTCSPIVIFCLYGAPKTSR